MCIARLEKEKLVEDVINVFQKLSKRKNDINLYIIGDGSLKHQLLKQINQNNLTDKAFIMSNKNQDWIYEMLTITTLVISPHTGRALCEAALAGSLIVAYDIDWQKEIIIQIKLECWQNIKMLSNYLISQKK